MLKEVNRSSPAAASIAQEEEILSGVLKRLLEFLDDRTKQFQGGEPSVYQNARSALVELRDMVGEARSFDVASLTSQMMSLAALANHLDPKLSVPADPASPYFAHIRLQEDGRERDVLIGKRSFVDAKNAVNIVDWRHAPVSRLYYTFEEGADYDVQYGDREVEGVMMLRRSLTILDGLLRRIQTPQGTYIRDDKTNMWLERTEIREPILKGGQLSATRAPQQQRPRFGTGDDRGYRVDKHLPEIAALIDPEQFERITQPTAGLVILQGGAGSGKTTVALHRVAYLNYQDKTRYQGDKILIAVFNRALARYITKVLPALDCPGIKVWTYDTWAHYVRRQVFPGLPKREWTDLPAAVARLKKHPAMLGILKTYVDDQTARVASELRERLLPDLWQQWEKSKGTPLVPRLQQLLRYAGQHTTDVASGLVLQKNLDRAKDVYSDWAEVLTDKSRIRRGLESYGDKTITEHALETLVQYSARQTLETSEVESDPVVEEEYKAVDEQGQDHDQTGLLDPLDNTLLLRLNQLKYGALTTPTAREIYYNHAVIDEAQDLSPLEIQVVIDATNDESVTLAGDTAQKLVFDNGFENWETLLASLGKSAIKIRPLRIAYRSTHEINLFGRAVLGPLAPAEPVQSNRSGVPVETFIFNETGETLAFLTDTLRSLLDRERQCNVALLALSATVADLYYEGLQKAEIHPLRRVRDQEFTFAPGVDITDISQIKGLEYDYVIILDGSAEHFPNSNEARHLLHIAATRAAHQLWVVCTGKLSPLIPRDSLAEV